MTRMKIRVVKLTEREAEVLEELLRFKDQAQIARYLGLSAHTVRNHCSAIFKKYGVSNRLELFRLLIDLGSIKRKDETETP